MHGHSITAIIYYTSYNINRISPIYHLLPFIPFTQDTLLTAAYYNFKDTYLRSKDYYGSPTRQIALFCHPITVIIYYTSYNINRISLIYHLLPFIPFTQDTLLTTAYYNFKDKYLRSKDYYGSPTRQIALFKLITTLIQALNLL